MVPAHQAAEDALRLLGRALQETGEEGEFLAILVQAVGEALALCQPLGLEPARLVSIFSDTSGGPNVLKTRGGMLADAMERAAEGLDFERAVLAGGPLGIMANALDLVAEVYGGTYTNNFFAPTSTPLA